MALPVELMQKIVKESGVDVKTHRGTCKMLKELVDEKTTRFVFSGGDVNEFIALATRSHEQLDINWKSDDEPSLLLALNTLSDKIDTFCSNVIKTAVPLATLCNLQRLHLSHIVDLSPLTACSKLEILHLSDSDIEEFNAILPSLKELVLKKCYYAELFDNVSNCLKLEKLVLPGTSINDLGPLQECRNLRYLDLEDCLSVKNVRPLKNCPLTEVYIRSELLEIDNIHEMNFKELEHFHMGGIRNIENLKFLEDADKLKTVELNDLFDFNLTGLKGKVESLVLKDCHLRSLSHLDCPLLKTLRVETCKMKSISGIERCVNLQSVKFSFVRGLDSLDGLEKCSKLQSVRMFYNTGITQTEYSRIFTALKIAQNGAGPYIQYNVPSE